MYTTARLPLETHRLLLFLVIVPFIILITFTACGAPTKAHTIKFPAYSPFLVPRFTTIPTLEATLLNDKPPIPYIWGLIVSFMAICGGRYRTRTYDLLCVREYHGVSTVSMCYIWWSAVHTVLPVGVYLSTMSIMSMSCYGGCTRVAHDMMENERLVGIHQTGPITGRITPGV